MTYWMGLWLVITVGVSVWNIGNRASDGNQVKSNELKLKMPSKLIRILRITFCYKQLCGRCLVHMIPVVKVVIHCVFALL